MSKEGSSTAGSFWRGMFSSTLYKRSQGRIARQVTALVLVIVVALGVWSLNQYLLTRVVRSANFAITGLAFVAGMWFCYRAVNLPRFADFLIQVEAEMSKVSWPTRHELVRSSIVVLITIFGLATLLFVCDLIWKSMLQFLGVIG